jgi:integrase/recombinase XerD
MKIRDLIPEYLKHMQALGRSVYTVDDAGYILKRFAKFLESVNVQAIEELSREVMEEYQQELAFSLTAKGKPLEIKSQVKALCTAKLFTRYLRDSDYLVHDPGAKIKLPREPKRLPRVILSQQETKELLAAPDCRTNTGYRDRVLLELLYDTAIRRFETAGIKLSDIDLDAGYMRVLGKGNKERVVPVSARVCQLLKNYLLAVRPELVKGDDPGFLFLNGTGERMHLHAIWLLVKRYAHKAKLKKNITTHTFRHTCVTHMLRNGAPIRHLQEMLGHESLESTQIYTHVTINDLKEVHAKYHPSERMPAH